MAAYFISTVPDPVKAAHEIKRVCKKAAGLYFSIILLAKINSSPALRR